MNRKRILIVERAAAGADGRIAPLLNPESYEVETLRSGASALLRMGRAPFPDAVLFHVEAADGELDAIGELRRAHPRVKIITLMANTDVNSVGKAVRMGADVCAWKPRDGQALNTIVENCLLRERESPAVSERLGDVEELGAGAFFVIASPAMRRLRAQVDQVARIAVPVLILGESGTGKEVIARLIHKLSPRAQRPFLKVNCAAVPAELLESELFGYERGAFTGAVHSKPGIFEACNRGTLFLDEIAEMSPALQAKLLHVLQDQEFSRLGSRTRIRVNVRILAATNVNIREAIAAKSFRGDLYYRLSAFVFSIPPLRERPEDIPILLRRYMAHHADMLRLPNRVISKSLWDACLRHSWPGNVRELENLTKRYLICGDEGVYFADSGSARSAAIDLPGPGDLKLHVQQLRKSEEAAVIAQALEQTNWNRKEAAKLLKISYKSMLSKIRLYGLDHAPQKTLAEYSSDNEPAPLVQARFHR